jgi:hypothetical protein
VYFGFDEARLLLRFDVQGTARNRLADIETLRIVLVEPSGYELLVTNPAEPKPKARLFKNDVPISASGIEAAADAILEIAVPVKCLGAASDDPLHFYAELYQDQRPIERLPHEGTIETVVPSPDFELMMWQA